MTLEELAMSLPHDSIPKPAEEHLQYLSNVFGIEVTLDDPLSNLDLLMAYEAYARISFAKKIKETQKLF